MKGLLTSKNWEKINLSINHFLGFPAETSARGSMFPSSVHDQLPQRAGQSPARRDGTKRVRTNDARESLPRTQSDPTRGRVYLITFLTLLALFVILFFEGYYYHLVTPCCDIDAFIPDPFNFDLPDLYQFHETASEKNQENVSKFNPKKSTKITGISNLKKKKKKKKKKKICV